MNIFKYAAWPLLCYLFSFNVCAIQGDSRYISAQWEKDQPELVVDKKEVKPISMSKAVLLGWEDERHNLVIALKPDVAVLVDTQLANVGEGRYDLVQFIDKIQIVASQSETYQQELSKLIADIQQHADKDRDQYINVKVIDPKELRPSHSKTLESSSFYSLYHYMKVLDVSAKWSYQHQL